MGLRSCSKKNTSLVQPLESSKSFVTLLLLVGQFGGLLVKVFSLNHSRRATGHHPYRPHMCHRHHRVNMLALHRRPHLLRATEPSAAPSRPVPAPHPGGRLSKRTPRTWLPRRPWRHRSQSRRKGPPFKNNTICMCGMKRL